MRMLGTLAALIATVAIGVPTSGVSAGTPELHGSTKPTPTAAADVQVFTWWTAGGEAQGLAALLRLFHQAYPQFRVVNRVVAGGAGSNAKLVLASRLIAHEPPDSFQVHADQELDAYVYAGYLRPLDALYRSQGWNKVFPKALLQDLSVNGHIFAVPVDVHRGNVLWYNPQIFRKYHIQPPQTLQQLLSVCKTLRAHGVTPLALGDTDQWESTMLWEDVLLSTVGAANYVRIWHGEIPFTNPGVVAATHTFVELLGYTNQNHASLQWSDASALVAQGKAAMNVMGDWANGYFTSVHLEPGTGFGSVVFPGTQKDFIFITDAFGLPKFAPDPTGAVDFLKVLGSETGQAIFNPLKGSIAARIDVPASLFDEYSKRASSAFKRDTLLPSLAHGEAANPGFLTQANNAMQVLVSDDNVDEFLKDLTRAAQTNPLR